MEALEVIMIKVAIVEDTKNERDVLVGMLNKYELNSKHKFLISVFESGIEFLANYTSDFDIIFMDIGLPGLNGMETAKKLREMDKNVNLIFVTNMAQYAVKGYEVDALAFLIKPLTYYYFKMMLTKAINRVEINGKKGILIQTEDGMKKIITDELLYIEVYNHYLTYKTFEKDYVIRQALSKVEKELLPLGFARCNNCYLVNLKYVKAIKTDSVVVENNELRMSRSRKNSFVTAFTNFIGENV